MLDPNLNDFCSGHLVVTKDRKITFCNHYAASIVGLSINDLVGSSLSQWSTKASNIFIDSYIYPLLFNELEVQEAQINWVGENGSAIPVIANIKLGSEGESYWSLYICINREKLQSELLAEKAQLTSHSEELFKLATTDPLTGLLNRRELEAQAEKISYHVDRNCSTYTVICIDIDLFKRVNDTFGHQMGDIVLQRLSEIFLENRRTNDLVARIGGEEFVLLLSDIDKHDAFNIAEGLRKRVAKSTIENIQVTISIGLIVSELKSKADFKSLLQLADQALYTSKNSGRNKTTLAEQH